MSDILFGEKSTPSQAVDTTPDEYAGLRNPLAQNLRNTLYGASGKLNQGYTGPFAAPMGAAEQQALVNVGNAAGQVGQADPYGLNALQLNAAGNPNPFASFTGLEQYALNNVAQQALGNAPNQQLSQDVLRQQISGQFNPFAQAAGLTGAEQYGLNAIQNAAFGANPLTQATNQSLQNIVSGQNPLTQQLINAAQRPIFENFNDEALAARGLFTGAGQQVQGQGSSPFAQASARLVGTTQNALNDAALGVTNQAFNQQIQALPLAQAAQGIGLENLITGQNASALPRNIEQLGLDLRSGAFDKMQGQQLEAIGSSDKLSGTALDRALSGLEAAGIEQNRKGEAFESAADRQVNAGATLNDQQLARQQAQLEASFQNLQAQGLPRMIEQLGIEGGIAEFQRQQQQLLALMGLAGGLSTGTPVVLPGQSGKPGLAQSFVGGLGQGIGGGIKLSDRRVKKAIRAIGEISGINIYEFLYNWQADDAPKLVGVMADEVEHIPGAVRDIDGIAHVDYERVIDYMVTAHA